LGVSGEDAKRIVHALVDAWNALDWPKLADLIDASMHDEDAEHFREIVGAFSDLRITIESMIAEGEEVAARFLITATHDRGPFAGVDPTGKRLAWRSFRFYRVRDGRVVASWAMQDRLGLFQQLGLVPELERLVHWAADQPGE
jgi:predicted ester cyclase